MLRSALMALVLLLVGVVGPAHATTLDFNAYEQPGSGFIIHPHPLDIAGYRFTSVDYSSTPLLTTFQQSSSFYNGSAALGCGNSSDLLVTRADGARFDALSVSLDSFPGAHMVEITGERPAGGNVQQVVTTDSSPGAEPVALVGLTGLTSLRFSAAGSTPFAGIFGQIDDLVVSQWQNQPPVADAGEDQTVFLGDVAALQGDATDPDGDPVVDWQWEVISAPAGSVYNLAFANTPEPLFTTDSTGNYVITLIAADYFDWSDPDVVLVTVVENLPPEAVAAASPLSGPAPLTVQFDGTGSSDPEGQSLLYNWNFGDGEIETGATPSHTFTSSRVYSVSLVVTDGQGKDDFDIIQITVTEPPPVPALSPPSIAVLALLLLGSAAFTLRRERGEPH